MDKPLFDYQSDIAAYVRNTETMFRIMKEGVDRWCGGFKGKTVLEVGAGFQLPHGGLTTCLTLRDGAKRVFGIDICSPDEFATLPDRVSFWKAAREMYGVDVRGLDEGRVHFASQNIIFDNSLYSPVTMLQMSASEMYFRDNMFDVMFSNAVFEHVPDARNTLKEMFRTMAPGGSAYIHWNPFTSLEMGGHDIGIPFYFPWAHLRLSEAQHVEMLRRVLADPALFSKANPPEHTITAARAAELATDPALFYKQMSADLNRLRVREFLAYAEEAGFEILHSGYHIKDEIRLYLTDRVRAELPGYDDDELLTFFHSAALRKPEGAA
ncbi:MAG: class I SAM-dependent methyltransferase [Micropepsaceae bacterium]